MREKSFALRVREREREGREMANKFGRRGTNRKGKQTDKHKRQVDMVNSSKLGMIAEEN